MSLPGGSHSCCVPGCEENTRYSNSSISFFRFPKDEERCAIWKQLVGVPEIGGLDAEQCYNRLRVCSKHFSEQFFAGLSKNRLKNYAVPTVFQREESARCSTKKCIVPSCDDTTSKRHRFPKNNEDLYNLWIEKVNVPILNNLPREEVYNKYFICDRHFHPKFFVPGTCRGLSQMAFPTEFLPETKEDDVEEIIIEQNLPPQVEDLYNQLIGSDEDLPESDQLKFEIDEMPLSSTLLCTETIASTHPTSKLLAALTKKDPTPLKSKLLNTETKDPNHLKESNITNSLEANKNTEDGKLNNATIQHKVRRPPHSKAYFLARTKRRIKCTVSKTMVEFPNLHYNLKYLPGDNAYSLYSCKKKSRTAYKYVTPLETLHVHTAIIIDDDDDCERELMRVLAQSD